MATMDLELKKAFTEMQVNKLETNKKVKALDYQCELLKTSKHKYVLTEMGTADLDANTRVYSSVGRMFVLYPVPQMREELKGKQEKCDDLIKQLNDKKEFLVHNLKEQEDGLRELVQQKKSAESK